MKWSRVLVAVLSPLALGLIGGWLLSFIDIGSNVLFVRAELSAVVALLGVGLSLLVLLVYGVSVQVRHIRRSITLRNQSEAVEERRRLLRRLDHELKNPLTAIRAALANLHTNGEDDQQKETLESIESQTVRLSRLTADLRKIAELDARPLEHRPVDMTGLLQEIMALTQEHPAAEDRTLTLTLPQVWPVPKVAGDRDLLFLAIYNLVDNAIKFSRPGDAIEIRAFEDGATLIVEVADTGPGIPEIDIPHVWEELYRGQSARSVPGSGLGLALVRAIVEHHQGNVSVRSRSGQGTAVSLRLPAKSK